MSKIDKIFTFWSVIWFAYFILFVIFSGLSYTGLIAIAMFIPLWSAFCNSLRK